MCPLEEVIKLCGYDHFHSVTGFSNQAPTTPELPELGCCGFSQSPSAIRPVGLRAPRLRPAAPGFAPACVGCPVARLQTLFCRETSQVRQPLPGALSGAPSWLREGAVLWPEGAGTWPYGLGTAPTPGGAPSLALFAAKSKACVCVQPHFKATLRPDGDAIVPSVGVLEEALSGRASQPPFGIGRAPGIAAHQSGPGQGLRGCLVLLPDTHHGFLHVGKLPGAPAPFWHRRGLRRTVSWHTPRSS